MYISTNTRIRLSELKDIPAMSMVEKSAGTAFLTIPELAWLDGDVMGHKAHRKAIVAKTSWVAEDTHTYKIVGFICAEQIATEFHLQEVSVHAEYQRQGIGRRLIATALDYATSKGALLATLTTFIDVPWNAPFYKKLDFEIIEENCLGDRLSNLLLKEKNHGLPRSKRCAMRKYLALE